MNLNTNKLFTSTNPQDHLIWWQLFYAEYAKEILEEGIGNTGWGEDWLYLKDNFFAKRGFNFPGLFVEKTQILEILKNQEHDELHKDKTQEHLQSP